MNLASKLPFGKFLSRLAACGVMVITFALAPVHAAELIMVEQPGCEWCAVFEREIVPIYGKTAEGQRAPLRRLRLGAALPPDLAFLDLERLTPLFVLVDKGREVGRIRGYPGEDHFWGLLGALLKKLDATGSGGQGAGPLSQNPLRAPA